VAADGLDAFPSETKFSPDRIRGGCLELRCRGPRMTDLDLYNEQILALAESIPRLGRLVDPDATATANSRICGSRITVDLELNGDVITNYAHQPRACAIG
jgi:hypothetical protein